MANKDLREQRATLKSVLQGPTGYRTLAISYEDKYNKLYIDNNDTLFICCQVCKELLKFNKQTSIRNVDNHYKKHAVTAGSKRLASNQLALIPPKRLDQKSEELSATQKKAINDSLMCNVIAGCRVSCVYESWLVHEGNDIF